MPRPSLARSVLVRLAPPHLRLEFARELDVAFADEAAHRGWLYQRWWLWQQALKGVVPMLKLRARARRAATSLVRSSMSSRAGNALRSVMPDLLFAVRTLRRRPGFSAVVIATLALGIGANTAIFSVVHAVLIREPPYPHPDRLVRVYETWGGERYRGVANPFNFDAWERLTRSFQGLAATRAGSATLTGAGDAERVRTYGVTATFFEVMFSGRRPVLGRVLTPGDAEQANPVIVISHDLWHRRFGADPNVIGRSVELDGNTVSVVGVLPETFGFPENCDVWRPYVLTPKVRAQQGSWYLDVVGRLNPGATIEQAQAEIDAVTAQLLAQYPKRRKDRGAWVIGLQQDLGNRVEDALWVLQGVVGVVLLVACANVANLLIASASGRRRELGIRASLGAGRGRLIRQMVTESVVVAIAGGAAGAALAVAGVRVLVANAPEFTLPAKVPIDVDLAALGFTIVVALATGLVAGIGPALLFSRPSAPSALTDDSGRVAGTGAAAQRWLRFGLVTLEVALAIVLVTGSALLIRSFAHIRNQEPGFAPERLLTATITLPDRSYDSPAAQQQFWAALFERLHAMPGAIAVGGSTALPFSNWEWQSWFEVRGREDAKNEGSSIRTVTSGYFTMLGLPTLAGRTFADTDGNGSDRVVVVNDAFARQHLAGANPIGMQLRTDRVESGTWMTIVGVVGNARHTTLDEPPQPEIYRPLAQWPSPMMVTAVRTAGAPEPLGKLLRQQVREIDPNLAVDQVRTMEDAIDRTVARRRFEMWLLSLFGTLGAVLAAIGIYGVTSFVAGLRRREMGIRLALGARPAQIKALVTRQGLGPVLVGLAAGLTAAWWLTALLESRLFEVTPRDPASLIATATGFLIVAIVACWAPARRAGQSDPVVVLKSE
jgi:putative ABC transport system permease protein